MYIEPVVLPMCSIYPYTFIQLVLYVSMQLPQPTSPLCVHVTDSNTGRPAEGVSVEVSVCEPVNADWTSIGCG